MWPIVRRGSRGEDVRTVQYLLSHRGHNLGVDGEFGPMTENEVRAFQNANRLGADGIVGPQTWPVLIVQVSQGSTGQAVRAVQSQLDHLRPGHAVVDGIFGPDTADGVRRFQERSGLVADAIVGPRTWEALVSAGRVSLEPHEAANFMFAAWRDDDPGAARQVATEGAVADLFSRQWRAEDGWSFARSDGTAGHLFFVWARPGEELALRVPSAAQGDEHVVDQVVFRSA